MCITGNFSSTQFSDTNSAHKSAKTSAWQICANLCVQSLCPRIVSTKNFRWCTSESFMRVNIVRHVCRKFSPCVRAEFVQIVHVRKCVQTVTCAKCPKMVKNDEKWPKSTIWPKCPKMAQNGPKWQKMSRVGTWLVTGPLRLVTQGGKSCQNMH